jgi:virulence-associated protein VapD
MILCNFITLNHNQQHQLSEVAFKTLHNLLRRHGHTQIKCTYDYFNMNFHATFLKQILIKHILSRLSGISEALQNICVMHTLQYEHVLTFWCKSLIHL